MCSRGSSRIRPLIGVALTLMLDGDFDALPAPVRVALLQVAREAIANMLAHSRATSFEMTMRVADGSTFVEFVDDGVGFDDAASLARAARTGRLGIVGMAERARLLGGRFALFDSEPGAGVRIRLWLPAAASGEVEASG